MLETLLKPDISITTLAREYGCTKGYVSRVVAGKQKPSPQFKAFCAKKFGLPISVLFPGGEAHDQ